MQKRAETLLRHVDLVIRNLGDNLPNTRGCKRKRKQHHFDDGAPVGLEKQYEELYSLLKQGLIGVESNNDNGSSMRKQNVSSLLMGPRGHGKSLVLDRCLSSLRRESEETKFRVVRLNGILLAGHNVTIAVQEIVRQLSEIVSDEENYDHRRRNFVIGTNTCTIEKENSNSNALTMREKLHDTYVAVKRKEAYDLRMRRTTFHHSLALLDEALQIACIDSIPILIVLDELDSFLINPSASRSGTGSAMSNSLEGVNMNNGGNAQRSIGNEAKSDRHLLLYHLLDRVNSSAALVSFVGITSRLPIYGLLEKRIKSRAEGTSRIVHFGKPEEFGHLVDIVLSNFDVHVHEEDAKESFKKLKDSVNSILLPLDAKDKEPGSMDLLPQDLDAREKARDEKNLVHHIWERHWKNGKSVKWFLRVLSVALTLYSETLHQVINHHLDAALEDESLSFESNPEIPEFDAKLLLEGLNAIGCDVQFNETDLGFGSDTATASAKNIIHAHPRIQDLLDLSGSQCAVVLSAKRILARDGQNHHEGINNKVLTYERIQQEYKSYFLSQGRSSGPDRFLDDVLFQAFLELMYVVFRPARDHTGVGMNEYHFNRRFSPSVMNHQTLKKLPLHWNIHEHVLNLALKGNKLDCSSALRDWAK